MLSIAPVKMASPSINTLPKIPVSELEAPPIQIEFVRAAPWLVQQSTVVHQEKTGNTSNWHPEKMTPGTSAFTSKRLLPGTPDTSGMYAFWIQHTGVVRAAFESPPAGFRIVRLSVIRVTI